MEDRFSQDNISHNNLRDSHSNNGNNGIQIRNKNINGGGSVNSGGGKNEIIPERRRKYLAGGSDDNHNAVTANTSVGPQILMDEMADDQQVHKKKNNKMNVHLQPLDHNPSARGSSVPPMSHLGSKGAGAHPLFAPSPNVRGGNGVRLESIDHTQHMINGLSN